MKKIKKLVKMIDEEIEGAKCYAEYYVENKAEGKTEIAQDYHKMASDELNHASILHKIIIAEIEKISKVFTPPADMMIKWEDEHTKYIETADWVKDMLNM